MANHTKSKKPEMTAMPNGSAEAADSLVKTKSHDQIRSMFDDVAPTYDLLNHVLSVGTDFYWRWRARQKAKSLLNGAAAKVLDVATGTGDLAIAMLKLPGATVKGMDVSPEMIAIARKKCPQISFEIGRAEKINFASESFNLVTAGFGVRNFEDLDQGLREFHRVLQPGGHAIILEPMVPRNPLIKRFYMFYFKSVLPKIARLFTRSTFAYDYLPRSVESFPQCDAFLSHLTKAGFRKAEFYPMTFETAIMYVATK